MCQEKQAREYERGILPYPPHLVKARTLREYQRRFSLETLVETGTWLGLMVASMKPHFSRIYSVELNAALAEKARRRFRKCGHVTIYQGDSGAVLPLILAELKGPALFWLDAHYSGQGT